MSITERINAGGKSAAVLGSAAETREPVLLTGRYHAEFRGYKDVHRREYLRLHYYIEELKTRARATDDRATKERVWRLIRDLDFEANALTELKRVDDYRNTVVDEGARYLLDNGLAGSGYTAAFYLGLISSVSYSAIAAGDTMAQIAGTNGWREANATNAPNYSEGARRTAAWSAASSRSKALSAGLVFTFSGSGTVKGSFLTTNSTKGGSTGTLYSAGLFTGGDQPVVSTNTITVSYTASA
jgi:hypothetical protein